MRVGDLREMLSRFDEDDVIYIADPNSKYAYSIFYNVVKNKGLASFYGKNEPNVLFLLTEGQIGSMRDRNDL